MEINWLKQLPPTYHCEWQAVALNIKPQPFAKINDTKDHIMRAVTRIALWTGCTLALAGTALAADMTGAEIKAFAWGKTVYLEATAAGVSGTAGQSYIYWTEEGIALNKTPTGAIWHGKTEIKGNLSCTEWKERPGTGCTRWDKQGDVVTLIDATSGAVRAKVVKTVPGNAEKLAP